ncbi:GNAT family N-acetyltransferase [Falsibacillus pallidus]|uniref:GNAT family N-acetyltransferase n=1 Tax=Falsibacillus pallidus TaxID=493781 RepID=UPI003D97627B
MEWKLYNTISQIKERAEALLMKEEAKNNLPLGLMYQLEKSERNDVLIAAIEDGQDLSAFLLMTPPHNLIISVDKEKEWKSSIQQAVESLQAADIKIPGVVAEKETASFFAEELASTTGQSPEIHMRQRIYQLREVRKSPVSEGNMRLADERESGLLTHWLLSFIEDTGEHPLTEKEAEARAAAMIQEKSIYLWEHNGKIVSMARKARCTKNVAVINFVFTPKDERKKGYASAVVSQLSQTLLKDYDSCGLYTDLDNPTSNKIYMEIGYEPVADSTMIKFD